MVKRIIALTTLLLLAQISFAASMQASVDRKQIGRSDFVTLQVSYNDMAGFSSPDWSVLERDWNIVNQDQQQKISFNNGKNTSHTDWTLTLVPRRSGTVLIPAIKFQGVSTDPIRIEVSDQASTAPVSTDNFYFEVEVSGGTHYVQEQIIYIERLYYTVNHEDANLSELTVADARIQSLMDPKQYVTVVDGKRIGVYERRYAIFPEVGGKLVIPGQRFTARVSNRFNRLRGATESVVSKLIELDVKPIPDSYPQAPWIPASKFTIEETYSREPQDWIVGEPVTRTMKISATGLSSGQIPPIPMPEIDGIRYYPDQTQDDSKVTEQGLVTTVVQSVALVPTSTGAMTLPEIQIPWWNTLTNTVEYATLPAQTIQVSPGAMAQPNPQVQQPEQTPTTEGPLADLTQGAPSYWKAALILLAGTNVITLALLLFFISKRNVQKLEISHKNDKDRHTSKNVRELWQALKQSATVNDPQAIRDGLIQWASASSGQTMTSLAEAEVWLDDVRISAALAELDETLYGNQTNSAFNGQGIISLLEKLKRKNEQDQGKNTELPDFYPK